MRIRETDLPGAYILDVEMINDERGFFARTWCQQEFHSAGIKVQWVQSNISWNAGRGTVRGMHYQAAPHEEAKLIRCTAGSLYDVIIDLRRDSPTFLKHMGVELSHSNHRMLYIPEGFAHGFQTLEDGTEALYMMSHHYVPESARGVRWNDPLLGIQWPLETRMISERDRSYPDFRPA